MVISKRKADKGLRELGCINKFYKEFYHQHQHIEFDNVGHGMIDTFLLWSDTEDGSSYWNRKDDEFNNWLDTQE